MGNKKLKKKIDKLERKVNKLLKQMIKAKKKGGWQRLTRGPFGLARVG